MTAPSEQSNERLIVNWLGAIALAAIVGAVALALNSAKATVGVDTAVIVALIGIAAAATSSLGTRRTRLETTTDPTQPPPISPELSSWVRDATGGTP